MTLGRKELYRDTRKEEGRPRTEAGIGVMQLRTTDCSVLPGATGSWKRRERPIPGAFGMSTALLTPSLFWGF